MSIYRGLLIYLHNLMVPAHERYVPPVVYCRYTFNMVGIGRLVTVTDKNRDDACRRAYDLLNERELDNLEWAELVLCEPITGDVDA